MATLEKLRKMDGIQDATDMHAVRETKIKETSYVAAIAVDKPGSLIFGSDCGVDKYVVGRGGVVGHLR